MTQPRTEEDFTDCLAALLNGEIDIDEVQDEDRIDSVVSFRDAGVLTNNAGCVVTMDDGTEFQITVVRSRVGR